MTVWCKPFGNLACKYMIKIPSQDEKLCSSLSQLNIYEFKSRFFPSNLAHLHKLPFRSPLLITDGRFIFLYSHSMNWVTIKGSGGWQKWMHNAKASIWCGDSNLHIVHRCFLKVPSSLAWLGWVGRPLPRSIPKKKSASFWRTRPIATFGPDLIRTVFFFICIFPLVVGFWGGLGQTAPLFFWRGKIIRLHKSQGLQMVMWRQMCQNSMHCPTALDFGLFLWKKNYRCGCVWFIFNSFSGQLFQPLTSLEPKALRGLIFLST